MLPLAVRLAVFAVIAAGLASCDGLSDETARHADTGSQSATVAMLTPPAVATVKTAQRRLAALGYDPGPIDGVLGKKTRIAIKHFQVDQEIEIDGRLTPRVIKLLEAAEREPGASRMQSAAGNGDGVLDSAGPRYEVGDTYVYDDGRVEKVARVGPERTVWETADGSSYTAYRNFILPPISWKAGTSKGENEIRPADGVKWPPATQGDVEFTVGARSGDDEVDIPAVWSGTWHCGSNGRKSVKTRLGKFDTIVIRCDRDKPDPGTWKTRIWYYVPEIGHYVRRVEFIHGTKRKSTVDLIAVKPGGSGWPTAARGGLDWAIQSALDSGNLETPVKWRSSAVGAMFEIHVGGTVPVSGNAECMRYELDRIGEEQTRRFPAIACKEPGQQRWLIPGLEPGAGIPRSASPK